MHPGTAARPTPGTLRNGKKGLQDMSIRIMPLGDSITSGSQSPDSGGYRVKLSQDFQAGGLSVDFVGEFQDGPSSLPDRDHEGKPFETAADLVSIVPNLMDTYRPD